MRGSVISSKKLSLRGPFRIMPKMQATMWTSRWAKNPSSQRSQMHSVQLLGKASSKALWSKLNNKSPQMRMMWSAWSIEGSKTSFQSLKRASLIAHALTSLLSSSHLPHSSSPSCSDVNWANYQSPPCTSHKSLSRPSSHSNWPYIHGVRSGRFPAGSTWSTPKKLTRKTSSNPR